MKIGMVTFRNELRGVRAAAKEMKHKKRRVSDGKDPLWSELGSSSRDRDRE
jgi:hypothetical protein